MPIAELHRLAGACERLNREVARAAQRQRFSNDAQAITRATHNGQTLLAKMNRLMDRRRAVEGHLMRVRGQTWPLKVYEQILSSSAQPQENNLGFELGMVHSWHSPEVV
jgi:hypothetical protein